MPLQRAVLVEARRGEGPVGDVVPPLVGLLLIEAGGLGQTGGADESGDFGGDGRRRVAAHLLPALLTGDGTVVRQIVGGQLDFRPQVDAIEFPGEDDRHRGLVHLRPVPVGLAADEAVLREAPWARIGLLVGGGLHLRVEQVIDRPARRRLVAGSDQGAGELEQVARTELTPSMLPALSLSAIFKSQTRDNARRSLPSLLAQRQRRFRSLTSRH